MAPGIAHRPGAFKQSNKGHSTGRHRSKGAVEKENRGRVRVKALSKFLTTLLIPGSRLFS